MTNDVMLNEAYFCVKFSDYGRVWDILTNEMKELLPEEGRFVPPNNVFPGINAKDILVYEEKR